MQGWSGQARERAQRREALAFSNRTEPCPLLACPGKTIHNDSLSGGRLRAARVRG